MLRQAQHERVWNRRLIPHAAASPKEITGIEVTLTEHTIDFTVKGPLPLMPAPAPPLRTDDLWRTTCFELFVQPAGRDDYVEFNFSPSTAWAAYRFSAYRRNMAELPVAPPSIEPIEHGLRASFDLSVLPPPPWRVGVSAVIEEIGGSKSYWALAHPDGPPDFHDPACFVLTLPAR